MLQTWAFGIVVGCDPLHDNTLVRKSTKRPARRSFGTRRFRRSQMLGLMVESAPPSRRLAIRRLSRWRV